ncbi:MAG: hypothetical protein Tsb0014_42850 [Pleurocapsa sp.]
MLNIKTYGENVMSLSSNSGSNESLSKIVNASYTAHHNLESTVIKAAYVSKLEDEQDSDSNMSIKLEIITTLVFIAIAFLVQFNGSSTEIPRSFDNISERQEFNNK